MLGKFDEQTMRKQFNDNESNYDALVKKSIVYRDRSEYRTMRLLAQTIPSLTKQGTTVKPSDMQGFRSEWKNRNGKPMDFATMLANPTDIENLLRSTGATSFGELDKYPTLQEGIRDKWNEYGKDYNKFVKNGVYPHVLTDLELRGELVSNTDKTMNQAVFLHRGKSLRSADAGSSVMLFDKANKKQVFGGKLKDANQNEQGQNRDGFNQAPIGKTAQTEQTATPSEQEPEPEMMDEQLMGWNGGTDEEGRQYRGLSHVMGAYLTKADAESVAKNIDSKELFDSEVAGNSVELLKHMRSNGYDFNIQSSEKRNQIDVRMSAGENVKVRVFDPEANGNYVGRVYDTYNKYYYNVTANPKAKNKTKFKAEDGIAILDYVTGNKEGKVTKSVSTESSRVEFDGVDRGKKLHVGPVDGRYRSLVFADEAEAKDYIESGIGDAKELVNESFRTEELQALIDSGLDDEDVLITSAAFQEKLEALYSNDEVIREAQERAAMLAIHSDDGGVEHLASVRDAIVGNYEDGFNPAFVTDHMNQTGRGNERNAMMAAIKKSDYDLDKLKGNDFAVDAMKERLVTFDPETAKSLDEIEHPMLRRALTTVQDTLKAGGFAGREGYGSDPSIKIDDNGIIQWDANRRTGSNNAEKMWEELSGEIGQVMVPNEDGIIETQFQGGNNYGMVPGYTGYFSFEGDYDDRMSRFKAKGFEQHLNEQLRAKTTHQMTRPFDKTLGNIPTTLDASGINSLYHGDVYGKRVELDFMETNQLNTDTKDAILKTLSKRVRFDNQFSDYATTSAETQANRDLGQGDDTSAFSYWKAAGDTNMRVLGKELTDEHGNGTGDIDIENYADMTMTGTGKTQGLIWFLTDGAEVNEVDGSVTPSKGLLQEDGSYAPDKTALQKLPYFDKKGFNAWDRNQMSSNQLMTALKVDENVNTALMSFGGWTFDDSYAVSKEFAERNKVFGAKPNEDSMDKLDELLERVSQGEKKEDVLDGTGMMWSQEVIDEGLAIRDTPEMAADAYDYFLGENGKFRPLQRGDKLSDFGGNKGTIGIVVDRDMPEAEAKELKLDKEVRFMKANPDLDVIGAPYSMLSRHNAGVVQELMDGETQDLTDPDTGEVFPSAMGQLNVIVTDMKVDDKTHAYSREDVLDGKGRKASGQLAWALQSKGADGIMNEIYGRNDNAWSTYREYLIATGLDMKADGEITYGYTPHADEERETFAFDPDVDSSEFLNTIKEQGGFLDIPFDVDFRTGEKTDSIPVLSASLRQNVELVDGSMRRSDFTNHYAGIYDAIGAYEQADTDEAKEKAKKDTQEQFDKIQDTIIDRQFNGGHNGKHSFIRDKIMGRRMEHSATGVAVVDPRLDIGEAGMNQDMMDALDAEEGDTVMMFRDPVWRDGAIRAMTVKYDDSVHGVAFNPISDKSHDGDFDGDSYGLIKFDSKEANRDLKNKFSHWNNMIDHGSGKDELYFQSGMDLASAQAKADKAGDTTPGDLYEKVEENAKSDNPKLLKKAQRDLSTYSHKLFREHGFGGDYVSLESDEKVFDSFSRMVENGAKGNPTKLNDYKDYHNGKKTNKNARDIQYASGVKSDDTGLAGAFSQKLVSVMRNKSMTGALESMYPLTQGTLQIKHDADDAIKVNDILTDDMNKTFRGKDVKNPKRNLNPHKFKEQLTDIMENKMDVDVNEKHIDAVTETLTHNGQIIPLKDAMKIKGSPMDRVAYGGGYDELKQLALKKESLLEGEQNKLFAPFTMRNADESTKLAKKDTQRRITESEAESEQDMQSESEAQAAAASEPTSEEPAKQASVQQKEEDAGISL